MSDAVNATQIRPLAAEYALGLLGPEKSRAFEEAMSDDPNLRASYAQWASHFAASNEELAPVTPPEEVFQNIDKAIFLQTEESTSAWRRYAWLPVAGLVLVAATLVIAFT